MQPGAVSPARCADGCVLLVCCVVPFADARRSAWCFGGWVCLFAPWMLLFMIAGQELLGSVYDKLDAYRIDLAGLGIGF